MVAVVDRYNQPQCLGQIMFQGAGVGVFFHRAAFCRRLGAALVRLGRCAPQCFGLAHAQPLLHHQGGQVFNVGRGQQGPGMAGGQQPVGQIGFHFVGQIGQPQCVGNIAAAFADHLGKLLLGVAKLLHQPLQAIGLLNRVEVFALHVLDDRNFQSF